MNCQKCGAVNDNSSNFCTKCGTKLNTSNINQINKQIENNEKNHKKGKKTVLIIIIILLVILILIFFITKSLIGKIKDINHIKINNPSFLITNTDDLKLPEALTCKSDNCHTLTIYFLENINSNSLDENYKSFSVEDGTVLDANELVKYVNDIFKMEVIKTDGETFTITMSGFSINIGWYYKDTDERFNFNEPITKDIEIEMKLFDGAIDNDFLKNIYDIFNR